MPVLLKAPVPLMTPEYAVLLLLDPVVSVLFPSAILPAPEIEPKVRFADNVKLPPDATLRDIEPVFESALVLDSV